MDRYTILIVEDDPVIRTQLQTLLQGAGYNTASPADFFDVAGQVQRIQPHLVLLDLTLPAVPIRRQIILYTKYHYRRSFTQRLGITSTSYGKRM